MDESKKKTLRNINAVLMAHARAAHIAAQQDGDKNKLKW